jgi:hypothetical protein
VLCNIEVKEKVAESEWTGIQKKTAMEHPEYSYGYRLDRAKSTTKHLQYAHV